MEIYTVIVGGIPHTVQLDPETAEKLQAEPVKSSDTAPVLNKARIGKGKPRVNSPDPATD